MSDKPRMTDAELRATSLSDQAWTDLAKYAMQIMLLADGEPVRPNNEFIVQKMACVVLGEIYRRRGSELIGTEETGDE